MNYELAIADIEKWQTDELFFRDYYHAVQNGDNTDELLQRPDVLESDKELAVDPLSLDPHMAETKFFEEGRNVFLVKHPRYLPYFTHQHAFFEILYVMRGHCQEITSDRRVEMREGDLCILAPNVTHGIRVYDDSIVINILIRHSTFQDIFLHAIRDKSQISLFFLGNLYEKSTISYLLYHTSGDELVRNYILDMYLEQMQMDDYSDRIICSLMTIFFTQLTRRHGWTVEIPDMAPHRSAYTDELMLYIMENYQTITLNDLADHFHFAVPYCSKLVKQISGSSFSDLITKVRLQQGENLLVRTQLSVAEIGDQIGYKNPETFIRAFQRVYHMSPSQYRRSDLIHSYK